MVNKDLKQLEEEFREEMVSRAYWNLSKDLDSQSKETIDFLHSLLIK